MAAGGGEAVAGPGADQAAGAARPSLPARFYTCPQLAARERRAIFAANWAPFGPLHELAPAGRYVARTVNGWPLLVLRDRQGELRAFHNACRHRGAALLAEGAGSCGGEIVCPYHGWRYASDGRLVLAPRFGAALPGELLPGGLLEARVDSWRGLIFVCIDREGPGLEAWLGALPALCADYPETGALAWHGSFAVEGRANWKTYCDNTVEGYHLPFVHKRLARAVAGAEVELRGYDGGRLVCFHVAYRGEGRALRGEGGLWFYRYPGFQAVLGPAGFKAERIEPMGAGALRSISWAWYDAGMDDAEAAENFAWAEEIVREDLSICETVQRNLEAGAWQSGWLSPAMEEHTAAFQRLVREDMAAVEERDVAGAGTEGRS